MTSPNHIEEKDMSPEEFIPKYEQALSTQQWKHVEPLIHKDACVTFSNGTIHKGKAEAQKAFEKNFSLIKNETYSIENVHWVIKKPETAIYLFEFSWSGIINDKLASGSGRGTCVLVNEAGKWQLLVEHLGPKTA
jgi:ketosteroid isomerase-like protein